MSNPKTVYIDPRVLRSMTTEPDPNADPALVRYHSDEVVAQVIEGARPPDELIIQIIARATYVAEDIREDEVVALTNHGKLYKLDARGKWKTLTLPELNP